MEKIEIKYKSKRIVFLILLFCTILIIPNKVIFSLTNLRNKLHGLIFMIPIDIIFLYISSKKLKQLLNNESILTFTDEEIILNNNSKLTNIKWSVINSITFESSDEGNNQYLVVKSNDFQKSINITNLEKSKDEISDLIDRYKK